MLIGSLFILHKLKWTNNWQCHLLYLAKQILCYSNNTNCKVTVWWIWLYLFIGYKHVACWMFLSILLRFLYDNKFIYKIKFKFNCSIKQSFAFTQLKFTPEITKMVEEPSVRGNGLLVPYIISETLFFCNCSTKWIGSTIIV